MKNEEDDIMYKIQVLMSTYNGAQYLRTQIDSILAQKNVYVSLLVRDDGSTDETKQILQEYADKGELKWYTGDNLGPAKSFMNLIRRSDEYDYYAFSDQDDYWLPDKLLRGIDVLSTISTDKPALYYSATTLVDADLNPITPRNNKRNFNSYEFTKFSEAVVSSNCTGCTMCFNNKLRTLINAYTPSYQIMHDGWLHKVCLALNGYVYYDHNSNIYYRQHNNNVIGGNVTPYKRWKRRIDTALNNPCPRSRGVAEILEGYGSIMPVKNKSICIRIANYKKSLRLRVGLLFDKSIGSPNKRIDAMYRLTLVFGLF